ncbi:hypothetical protein pb186bvf_005660 [Paramecium bursaria]
MLAYSAYYSNQKSSPAKNYALTKSDQKSREQLYTSQLMSKALYESTEKQRELRANSPTYKITDTINQQNIDIPIHKSCIKKGIFSGNESIKDPTRNIHLSHNGSNDQLAMFRDDHFMKKHNNQALREMSAQKDWRSSIRCFQAEQKEEIPAKRLRKSVIQENNRSEKRDPILSPETKEKRRVLKAVDVKNEPQRKSCESKKIYQLANSSSGFKESLLPSKPSSAKQRDSATFKSEVKHLLQYPNQKISYSDFKGSDNIKKNKKYCIKVDMKRPTSAFVL